MPVKGTHCACDIFVFSLGGLFLVLEYEADNNSVSLGGTGMPGDHVKTYQSGNQGKYPKK